MSTKTHPCVLSSMPCQYLPCPSRLSPTPWFSSGRAEHLDPYWVLRSGNGSCMFAVVVALAADTSLNSKITTFRAKGISLRAPRMVC